MLASLALLAVGLPLSEASPWSALWTTPSILLASVLITWGAEAAQFFVAQGFALAILALMQTLPEFAVEAVLAWHQQTGYLLANLTGALRLLTGLAWPMIYVTAAVVYRKKNRAPLRFIKLEPQQSVEVVALLPPLLYATFIWWKGNLHFYDALVLVVIYLAYLAVLTRLPAQEHEQIEDLNPVPRKIVQAASARRTAAIVACFVAGGAMIYLTAEPFLGSIIAVATAMSIPTFVVIQWFAPVVSEFPELASTFYFARQSEKASIGIINIASSNINQWTLLVAMLPVVFSMSLGRITGFNLDPEQGRELLLTISQSLAGSLFLLNMKFAWWEALTMFVLFAAQFLLPAVFGNQAHLWITYLFFAWAAMEVLRLLVKRKLPSAVEHFFATWSAHVIRG